MIRHARLVAVLASGAVAAALLATTGLLAQQVPITPAIGRVVLAVNRSTVLSTNFDITRIAITNPDIADATAVEARQVLIDGKAPGTVSLIIWGEGRREIYDLVVDPGVSLLQQRLQGLFPGEDIQVAQTEDAIILSGHATNNSVMLRAGEIAEATAPKSKVINLLQLPGGMESQQVMLQVRIAEVSRQSLTEAGLSLFTGAAGYKDYIVRSTTQQFGAPTSSGLQAGPAGTAESDLTFSDLLNFFVFNTKYNMGAVLRALRQSGNFQSLAEPNLIAYNGQEASFLAGGELPIPVVQGVTGGVTIQYKEYGIRLSFRPTIAGDVIRLRVKPEVSTLDYPNGVTLSGFRIPAISTRRAETDVELRDGQSFAIAGLMSNLSQQTRAGIPGLSSLPIIGYLFKSKADDRHRTELMVLVTPRLVRPLNPDEVPQLPTGADKFLPQEPDAAMPRAGAGVVDAPAIPGVANQQPQR